MRTAVTACLFQVPHLSVNPATEKLEEQLVDGRKQLELLELNSFPLSFSFGVQKGKLVSDPCYDEEKNLSSFLTVVANADGVYSGTTSSDLGTRYRGS